MFHKLLLVEDSAPMRDIIMQILGDRFGVVEWAAEGGQVLARAAEVMPDTILLDISLPEISGLMLLPLLREAHRQAHIVMLTNHTDDLYHRHAIARGADGYVVKSNATRDLIPAILACRREVSTAEVGKDSRGLDSNGFAAGVKRRQTQIPFGNDKQ